MKSFSLNRIFTLMIVGALLSSPVFAAENSDDIIVMGQDDLTLTNADMDTRRGAAGDFESSQTLEATTSGNVVSVTGDLSTGAVSIGNHFGNAGLGSYVINTGNNSSINSAVSVNVQMMSGL